MKSIMKSKKISVLILSITLILSSTLILASFGLSKKPEPKSELITFTGDLEGLQEVGGCCGNAGPFPSYTMTLSDVFPWIETNTKTYDGNIFMNRFGRNMDWAYKVQFWWTETKGDTETEYFIEIRGGVIEQDKKTKILTVRFIVDPCEIWIGDDAPYTIQVNFVLTRDPHHPAR